MYLWEFLWIFDENLPDMGSFLSVARHRSETSWQTHYRTKIIHPATPARDISCQE
jgi:hypothetical protein